MQNLVKIIKLLYTKENEARGKQKSTNNSKTCRFPCVIIFLCVDQMPLNIFHSSILQLHQIPPSSLFLSLSLCIINKMLLKFNSPFKMEDEVNKQSKQHGKSSYAGHAISYNNTSLAVGLRILTQVSHGESNILMKSALKLTQPTSHPQLPLHLRTKSLESCFLKVCHLCDKELSPDKDVYMYR